MLWRVGMILMFAGLAACDGVEGPAPPDGAASRAENASDRELEVMVRGQVVKVPESKVRDLLRQFTAKYEEAVGTDNAAGRCAYSTGVWSAYRDLQNQENAMKWKSIELRECSRALSPLSN